MGFVILVDDDRVPRSGARPGFVFLYLLLADYFAYWSPLQVETPPGLEVDGGGVNFSGRGRFYDQDI